MNTVLFRTYLKPAIISSLHIYQFCVSRLVLVMKVSNNQIKDKNQLFTFSLLFSFMPTWLPLQEEFRGLWD